MRLVIDFGAVAHRIRRALVRLFGISGWDRCYGCNARLTADERHYYAGLCNRCEGYEMDQLERAERGACSAPDCDCEPGIECAGRAAARGVPAAPATVLVPLEPTPEMLTAGCDKAYGWPTHADVRRQWAAMLDAAGVQGLQANPVADQNAANLNDNAVGVKEQETRDCAMCGGRGFYGTPGRQCEFCCGAGKVLRRSIERADGVEAGDCGNAECNWRGPISECSHIGTVGPCCPQCREIVEPDAPGVDSVDPPDDSDIELPPLPASWKGAAHSMQGYAREAVLRDRARRSPGVEGTPK